MSNRPSFQFYPADWDGNPKLKRCSFHLHGVWLAFMRLVHGSEDEYGVIRWNLEEVANAIRCDISDLEKLVEYGILKGCDKDTLYTGLVTTVSDRNREKKDVVLIESCQGPIWLSSRMVRDEYIRNARGSQGHKSLKNPNVPRRKDTLSQSLSQEVKDTSSPSPSSSSSSSNNIYISEIPKNEKKEKPEKRVSDLVERSNDFKKRLWEIFKGDEPPERVKAFFDYWSEANRSGTQMRFEGEKFFDPKKRMVTWKRNEKDKKGFEPKPENTNQPYYQKLT